uniref:Uncharacterized protein n=1 Tax=viral metagenome TaxID=1070528 RepID=A0A6M3KP61_9ZZZZ
MKNYVVQAQRLDSYAQELERKTIELMEGTRGSVGMLLGNEEQYKRRIAEIRNIRTGLSALLAGLLSDDDEHTITETSRRLLELRKNKGSAGKHDLIT